MNQLFLNECRKYQKWIPLVFIAMLLVYGVHWNALSGATLRTMNLSGHIFFVTALVSTIAGFIFGLLQMYSHRRANRWTYLVHRPLSTTRIFMALTGAGLVIFSLVIILPILLVTFYQDAFTSRLVDVRDYRAILLSTLIGYAFYLASCLVMTSANRGAALLFIPCLGFFFWIFTANPFPRLLATFISIGALYYLCSLSFKPDLKTHVTNPLGIVLHAVLMMIGIVVLMLYVASMVYDVSRLGSPQFTSYSSNSNSSNVSSYDALRNIVANLPEDVNPSEVRMAYALEQSQHADRDYYIAQAGLTQYRRIPLHVFRFPFRGQVGTNTQLVYFDEDANTHTAWTFSHNSMLFEGRDVDTLEPKGFLGKQGFLELGDAITQADRFDDVPSRQFLGDWFMVPNTIYHVNFAERLLEARHQLSGEEVYANQLTSIGIRSGIRSGTNLDYVFTDQRMLIFDPRLANDERNLVADVSVPYPTAFKDIGDIRLHQFEDPADGYLIEYIIGSHFYVPNNFYGSETPRVEVVHVSLDGSIEVIGTRTFTTRLSTQGWQAQMGDILAPVLYSSMLALKSWIEATPNDLAARFAELSVKPQMLALQLLSIVIFALLFRAYNLAKSQRIVWFSLVGIFGLPALISFFLLNPKQQMNIKSKFGRDSFNLAENPGT